MLTKSGSWRTRFLPALMHRTYQQADVIVAVSRALGDDLATCDAHPAPERIVTIYNPVVGANLAALWPRSRSIIPGSPPDAPPVILSAGRLSAAEGLPDPDPRLRRAARDPRCDGS